ncbi:lipoprotein insertase outer membrane protein LolB [Endozoicomonadaceae bacterium StTr2]
MQLMSLRYFRVACLGVVVFLAGCAGQQKVTPAQKPVELSSYWKLEGKLGIKAPEESGSTLIGWNQTGDNYDITLTLPFGRTLANIEGANGKVTLRVPGQPERTADSAELLLWYQLGWRIPVSQLFYWVQGVPAPNMPLTRIQHENKNDSSLVAEIEQGGWVISYDRYGEYDGMTRPGRIKAHYADLKLTLIIKEWQSKKSPKISK